MDIEEIIRRAQSEGRFSELPGHGKPLNLSRRQLENPVAGVAKEAGCAPEWAQIGKELEASREETQRLNARWLARKEVLLSEAKEWLRRGRGTEAAQALQRMRRERDDVARDLTALWTRDRFRAERYNLLVPMAHQQRTVPSPAHMLRVFLERSPDLTLSPENAEGWAEEPPALNVTALLEEARQVVKAEEGERPRMSSLRAGAIMVFKQRYGGRG